MPEKKDEATLEGQIGGEASGSTTDLSIERQITRLRHELTGIPDSQIIVDSVSYPVSVNITPLVENGPTQFMSRRIILDQNSPLHILELRSQKRVARSTNDEKALRELRKAA